MFAELENSQPRPGPFSKRRANWFKVKLKAVHDEQSAWECEKYITSCGRTASFNCQWQRWVKNNGIKLYFLLLNILLLNCQLGPSRGHVDVRDRAMLLNSLLTGYRYSYSIFHYLKWRTRLRTIGVNDYFRINGLFSPIGVDIFFPPPNAARYFFCQNFFLVFIRYEYVWI